MKSRKKGPNKGESKHDFAALLVRLQYSDAPINEDKRESYNQYNDKFKNINDIHALQQLLNDMLDANLFPDINILNQTIFTLGSLGFKQYAHSLYIFVIEQNLANAATYSNILDVMAYNKPTNKDKKEGEKIFRTAKFAKDDKNHACISPMLYRNMILLSANVTADLKEAKALLQEAKENNCINGEVYSAVIRVITNNYPLDIEEAMKILTEAQKNQCVSISLYNQMLKVIMLSDNPDVELAEQVWKMIKQMESQENGEKANERTYSMMLDVMVRSKKLDYLDRAIQLFKEAKSLGLDNLILYQVIIDMFVEHINTSNDLEKMAMSFFEEALKKGMQVKVTNSPNGSIFIDLHTLSKGTTYLFLKTKFKEILCGEKPVKLNLIYGKGKHSQSREEKHPLKQAVERIVGETMDHVSKAFEDPKNQGRFCLTLNPKPKEQKRPQKINTARYLEIKHPPISSLNPKSPSFIPSSPSTTSPMSPSFNLMSPSTASPISIISPRTPTVTFPMSPMSQQSFSAGYPSRTSSMSPSFSPGTPKSTGVNRRGFYATTRSKSEYWVTSTTERGSSADPGFFNNDCSQTGDTTTNHHKTSNRLF